jgi:hypothetical protein
VAIEPLTLQDLEQRFGLQRSAIQISFENGAIGCRSWGQSSAIGGNESKPAMRT